MESILSSSLQCQVPTEQSTINEMPLLKTSAVTTSPDKSWIEIPKSWDFNGRPSICWVDLWSEKTCSVISRIEKYRDGKKESCTAAANENKEFFDTMRDYIEGGDWSLKDSKRLIQWAFNCFGKLPPKTGMAVGTN